MQPISDGDSDDSEDEIPDAAVRSFQASPTFHRAHDPSGSDTDYYGKSSFI